jgi:hypothetical protein
VERRGHHLHAHGEQQLGTCDGKQWRNEDTGSRPTP